MDYKEFEKIMLESKDWELFFSLESTVEFPDEEDIYYTCLLCGCVTGVNAEEMHKIDDLMAEHVWKKHRHEAEKAVREYWEALGA